MNSAHCMPWPAMVTVQLVASWWTWAWCPSRSKIMMSSAGPSSAVMACGVMVANSAASPASTMMISFAEQQLHTSARERRTSRAPGALATRPAEAGFKAELHHERCCPSADSASRWCDGLRCSLSGWMTTSSSLWTFQQRVNVDLQCVG